MANSIQIFESAQFGQIRTAVTENGEPLFCLADVCKALELQPAAVMRRLGDGVTSNHPTVDSLGRTQDANFVNEDGLYDVILDSRKPEARKFRKWVTCEVLPSIRKSGGYMVARSDETPEQIMARALMVAQATIERHAKQLEAAQATITSQSEQLKAQAAKVEYTDNVLNSVNTYTSTQIAKELDLRTADQLHKLLKSYGVMIRQSGQWMLTAKYCGQNYTKTRTHSYTRQDGTQGTSSITVWTERGRLFLHQLTAKKWASHD